MVQATAFLALEASLSQRLHSTLRVLTDPLYLRVKTAIDDHDWEEASSLVHSIDLTPIFKANEDYIRYLSNVAMLFGASRVTSKPGTSAVALGFAKSTIAAVVETFRLSIEYNLKEDLVEQGLQLIAQARSATEPAPEMFSISMKGEYLGRVLKAGKSAMILPFDSFMDKQGKALFNIASSLHTSRLSAFGYTAEAEYLGITEYQISEQLDGRTCPVCSLMHGKRFQVSDARNLLDTVVRTQDPDELKNLQPWPSQSKQALIDMAAMTTDELVAMGWHVPPFHPRCRGLLTKSGTVTELVAGKPAPTQDETYEATKEDFAQLGIQLSPSKINLWNKLMQTSPAEVIANLTGTTQDKLLAKIMGAENPQDILGLANLSVTSTGVNVELQSTAFGSKSPVTQDYYFRKDQSLYVGSIKVDPEDSGVVRKVLQNLYSTAKSTSMTSLKMVADSDMSGYAWAKYGLSLSPRQWGLVKAQIKRSAAKMEVLDAAPVLELKAYDAIMQSPDPKSIFALADLPVLGEKLLSNTTWAGALDFNDPESVSRFLATVGGAE